MHSQAAEITTTIDSFYLYYDPDTERHRYQASGQIIFDFECDQQIGSGTCRTGVDVETIRPDGTVAYPLSEVGAGTVWDSGNRLVAPEIIQADGIWTLKACGFLSLTASPSGEVTKEYGTCVEQNFTIDVGDATPITINTIEFYPAIPGSDYNVRFDVTGTAAPGEFIHFYYMFPDVAGGGDGPLDLRNADANGYFDESQDIDGIPITMFNFHGITEHTLAICTTGFTNASGNCVYQNFTWPPPDTTPPVITLCIAYGCTEDSITRQAINSTGYNVTYFVRGTDDVAMPNGNLAETIDGILWQQPQGTGNCSPAPGSLFPVGVTTVTCSAADAAGNVGTLSFPVTILAQDVPVAPFTIHNEDSTGGDCQYIGTWNPSTNTCTLTTDFSSTGHGIKVKNDITIDGAGHTITGGGHVQYWGVDLSTYGPDNVTIKNLTIKNFGIGIRTSDTNEIIITGNTITESRATGIYTEMDEWLEISNNVISSTWNTGIKIVSTGPGYGGDCQTHPSGADPNMKFIVKGNTVSNSVHGSGITATQYTDVCFHNNTVNSNGYSGFSIAFGSGGIFTNNVANGNDDSGFRFNDDTPEIFTGNSAINNGLNYDGITVPDTTPPVLTLMEAVNDLQGSWSGDTSENITRQATNSTGYNVTFTILATDDVGFYCCDTLMPDGYHDWYFGANGGPMSPPGEPGSHHSCSPVGKNEQAWGYLFPIGVTTVTCSAADAAGNVGTLSFSVIVVDAEAEAAAAEAAAAEAAAAEAAEIVIPSWIKNNAGWWDAGLIDDRNYVTGLQWLISNGVMTIPSTEQGTGSDDVIPSWVKNNARWWADDSIDDRNYVTGLQWLISNGVMIIG